MRVDLPIPGSPPMRIMEPGTMPPPGTRSNSPMPEAMRSASAPSITSYGVGRPPISRAEPGARPFPAGGARVCRSSTKLFHSPQSGQRPSHLELSNPQAWQEKTVLTFALAPMGATSCLDEGLGEVRGEARLHGGDAAAFHVDPRHARADAGQDLP